MCVYPISRASVSERYTLSGRKPKKLGFPGMALGLVSVLEQSRKHEPAATAGISTPLERRIVGTAEDSILLAAGADEAHEDDPSAFAVAARRAMMTNFIIVIGVVLSLNLNNKAHKVRLTAVGLGAALRY
mmetsp:Transcript_666/g.1538  ORF Transcript_666/g.1538 Transcript_666/m.1538 type:complete len:130 (-) Transcript_666:35-424(-)